MRSLLVKRALQERSARRHAFRSNPFMRGVCLRAVLRVVYVVRLCCDGFHSRV